MPRDGLDERAKKVALKLQAEGLRVQYDESGAIGRRYARMDEIGTPSCVTIDYETLEQGTVTVRDRDSTKQERVAIGRLARVLAKRVGRK